MMIVWVLVGLRFEVEGLGRYLKGKTDILVTGKAVAIGTELICYCKGAPHLSDSIVEV